MTTAQSITQLTRCLMLVAVVVILIWTAPFWGTLLLMPAAFLTGAFIAAGLAWTYALLLAVALAGALLVALGLIVFLWKS